MSSDTETGSIAGATVPGARRGAARDAGARIGRYVVEGVVGQGGQGTVLAAEDPLLERHVAIKLLRHVDREALLREGQAIARLRHPNVVTVYDIGEDGDDLFIAMELVRGMTLHGWLRDRRGWREVLARFVPAARGLAAAHAAGLAHGDFKPANVLLGDDGRVVVSDFGLAREAADVEDVAGGVHGTPAYLAPEQWAGARADARSDQFAFCVALYEAVYGARPFDVPDKAALAVIGEAVQRGRRAPRPKARVPRWLARAIDRGLAIDPQARFPSMDALIRALTPRRSQLGWIVAAAALAVVVGASAAALVVGARRGVMLGAVRACDAAADRASPLALADGPHAAWFAMAAARWSAFERAVCLRDTEEATAARACLRRALLAMKEAARDDGAAWPALPALADCLAPPTAPRALPSTILVGPQGAAILAPDQQSIAVSSYAGDAQVVQLDTFATNPAPGVWSVLDWLPDGTWLVHQRDGSIAARSPAGELTELAHPPRFRPQTASLSPDGRWLALELGDRVEVRDRSGAVVFTFPGDDEDIAWEPGGARLGVVHADALHVIDVLTGGVVRIPLGVGGGAIGMRRIAWPARGRVLVTGTFDETPRAGIWELHVGPRGLVGYPELRLVPGDDQLYMAEDARGGRLVLARFSIVQRMFERRGAGGARDLELPSTFNGLRLVAADTSRDLALAIGPAGPVRFALSTRAPEPLALQGTPVLHDGRIEALRADGEHYTLGDLAFTFAGDAVEVRCADADSSRCVISARRGTALAIAPLSTPSHVITIEGGMGTPAPSPDGRRVLVSRLVDVVEVDLATGAILRTETLPADCAAFAAGWEPAGNARWGSIGCPDRFALIRWTAAGTSEELVTSDGWVSGVVALGPGRLLYSLQDHDPRLFLVDGI